MARPALEVADILRDHGPAWREANRGHVSLEQLKVMSAIERCRTAALGGHVARCENAACGHTEISYNSCVMGNLGNGESTGTWDLGVKLFHGFHHGHPYNQLPISQMLTGRRPIVIWSSTAKSQRAQMLERYFSAPKMLGHLRAGPSGPYIDGFAAALHSDGYRNATAVRYIRAAIHLGYVLQKHGGDLADIDISKFDRHLQSCRCPRWKGGKRNHHTLYGAKRFRDYLVRIGVCKRPDLQATEKVEPQLVVGFRQWLRKHRGAAAAAPAQRIVPIA